MSEISDRATVTLTVNGEQAKQMMTELESKIKDTEAAIRKMKAANADPKDIEKARGQLKTYQKQLEEMKSATEGVGSALSNLDKATPRQLERSLRTLKRQLKDMTPGTEVWNSHVEKIKELETRLRMLRGEVSAQESLWTKFKNWSESAWPALDLLRQWGGSVTDIMYNAVDAFAKMDQEMAGVVKFTGMTKEQVAALNEDFKKMDTRTSREGLNQLAQEAGRLGKSSREDVLGFVRAADQINVALDDLGAGATLTLSKLTGIFGDEKRYGTEQSLLKVGSVINELSQNCSASAPYLADFTERLGGVGAQAGMTIQQIMGFAAVLDSNSQKVEASSTALSQVIVRMMQDPAKYARVAGLDVKEFSDMLRTDANGALLLFLETLQKAGGMDVLSPMFKDMGENGARAIAALSTLASHIEEVKAQQAAANVAFQEGTSITKEFDVQNNTKMSGLEKRKKEAYELRVELGEHLEPVMGYVISSGSALMRVMLTLIKFIAEHKAAIVTLTAAIVAYNIAIYAATIRTKALAVATTLWNVVTKASNVILPIFRLGVAAATNAVQYFTNGLKVNYAMQQRWSKALAAIPFNKWAALAVAATATVITAIGKLGSKTDEQAEKYKEAVRAAKGFSEELAKEKVELDKLFGALDGAREGTEAYNAARDTLMSKYGAYMQGLIDEKGKILDLESAYNRLTTAIKIANQERGLENARAGVENVYSTQMSELTAQLSQTLSDYGVGTREASGLVQSITTSMAMGVQIPQETIDRINEISSSGRKSVDGKDGRWARFGYNGSAALNKLTFGLIGSDFRDDPGAIVNKMFEAQTYRLAGLDEIDALARLNRPLKDLQANMLEELIRSAEEAVDSGGGNVLKVSDALAGVFGFEEVDEEEARKLLEEYRAEYAYRNGKSFPAGSGVVEPNIPGLNPDLNPDPDPTPDPDKFEQEKKWRREQEAYARISYAKGESDYREYTSRMDEIATQYYDKLRARTDLSASERLDIEAEYHEAANKEKKTQSEAQLAAENESYAGIQFQLKAQYAQRLESEELSAEARAKAEQTYREAVELAELEHLKELVALTKEGSEERAKAEQQYLDARLKAAERHQQEYEKQQADSEKRLASFKDKYFGMNAGEKQSALDKDLAALKAVYDAELLAAGDNADEKLRIDDAYHKAKLALQKQYGQQAEEDSRNAMQRAVDAQVEWLNGEGGKALTGTLGTLVSGMSSIFSGLSTLIQAELEIQTAKIEKRYSREVELAEGNSYKVAKLEKKKEAEIAKLKNEANKKMFAMQVIQAVAQTAQNAISAYGSALQIPIVGLALAPIAAAMAVAAGAIQIAAIKKQQQSAESSGYSKGGFTKPGAVDEPAGIVHAGEWVASQKLLANPVARPMIEALDYAQRTNTIGLLREEDVSRSIRANDSLARIAEDDGSAAVIVAAMARNSMAVDALVGRLNEPLGAVVTVTGDHGIRRAESEYERLMKNKSPKSRK